MPTKNRPPLIFLLVVFLLMIQPPAPVQAESLPSSAHISGVTGHAQGYSLSCESRSAADWAAFWGVKISEREFLLGLPRSDDPDTGFVGSPNDPWGFTPPYSYGVHAEPVAALLREYGLEAHARRDLKWKNLRAEIAGGRPVIVWVIGQMWQSRARPYQASNGHTTTVAPYEHTMILVGYEPGRVYVVDAYSGQNQVYPLKTFLASWSVLGNMAVTGQGKAQATVEPAPAEKRTYVVQRGDYLKKIAAAYGLDWQTLAAINGIMYPYVIYPGQVLRLK